MAETDIERCARAVAESQTKGAWEFVPDESATHLTKDDYRAAARAVLLALREPSERMRRAAGNLEPWVAENISDFQARTVFQAMIDAALGEK